MNIVVCMKQVPDVEGRIVVDKGEIAVQALVASRIINRLDLLGVELAMGIKENTGGRLTLVSLGTPEADEALRHGIAMGADDAVLVTDTAFDDNDSYATATALARVIAGIPHDLVLCGRQADDSQSGQVGAWLAAMLGLALVQGVVAVAVAPGNDRLRLQRKLTKGDREVLECSLPVVLTVETGMIAPRNATIKGVLKARKQEIDQRDHERLGLTAEEVGAAGSKTEVTRLTPPKPRMKGLFVPDSKLSSADKLRQIMGGGMVQKKSDFLEGEADDVARQLLRFFAEQKIVSGAE